MKVSLSATPVTMPGRAIGRITRNETVSRPKKRCRATASDASVPRKRATAVAAAPTFSDVTNASLASVFFNASGNQCRVRPGGGHSRRLDELNA